VALIEPSEKSGRTQVNRDVPGGKAREMPGFRSVMIVTVHNELDLIILGAVGLRRPLKIARKRARIMKI
jgi:hypothetical protein